MKRMILVLGLFFIVFVISCEKSDSPTTSAPPEIPASTSIIKSEPAEPADPGEAEENVVEPPEVEDAEQPLDQEDDNQPKVVDVQPPQEPEPPDLDIPLEDKDFNELTDNQQYAVLVLGPGSKVIVQNTIEDHGLHVRDPAGLHLGDDNIIGHMFNGATGTIVDGHEIVSNLFWFKIKWNDIEGLGRCEINDRVPCVGWSAAVSEKDARLLQLVED